MGLLLDVKYETNEHDKLVDIVSDWDRDDKDSPATARGYMYLYLYSRKIRKYPWSIKIFTSFLRTVMLEKKTKDMDFNKIKHESFFTSHQKEEEEEEK